MKIFIIIITALSLILSGCATLFGGGGSQQVQFTSQPSGASVDTQLGGHCDSTPCYITMQRKSTVATFDRPGCKEQQVPVNTSVNGVTFVNILIPIGFIVDAVTGAMLKVDDTHTNLKCS